MRLKYLFVLKVVGYSALIYLAGHQLFHTYATAMTACLNAADPRYHLPNNVGDYLYTPSMAVIAFLSLTLATPEIPLLKKSGIILLGLFAFVFTDFFFIQFLKGSTSLNENSFVLEFYLCIKWLLPFLLWITMSYPYMEGLVKTRHTT